MHERWPVIFKMDLSTNLTAEHERIINLILASVHRSPNDFIYEVDISAKCKNKSERLIFKQMFKLLTDLEIIKVEDTKRLVPGRNNHKYRDIGSLSKLI